MVSSIDRTQQLAEASRQSRFGQKAALQAAGVPTAQHNVGVQTKKPAAKTPPAKKTTTKSSSAKKTASKSAAKQPAAKKS